MQKLVALACVVWLLPLGSHAEQFSFRLDRGGDKAMCRDYLAQVNATKPSYAQFSCGLTVATPGSSFFQPEWQDLNVDEHLDLIYLIEQQVTPTKLPPLGQWRQQYVHDERQGIRTETGYGKVVKLNFHPRLRQTRVRFWAGGPVFAVMGYTADKGAELHCTARLSQCPPTIGFSKEETSRYFQCGEKFNSEHGIAGASGEYLFVYESEAGVPEFIGAPDASNIGGTTVHSFLLLYNGVAFMVGTGAGINGVQRVEQTIIDGRALSGSLVVHRVCAIGTTRGQDNGKKDESK